MGKKEEKDTQRPFAGFGFEAWEAFTREQIEKTRKLHEEFAVYEGEAAERARKVIDETAAVMKKWLDKTHSTFAEWRKTAIEKSAAMFETVG